MDIFARTEQLIGAERLDMLKKSKVIVFGIGGVGSYACEALARCGVGHIALVDFDTVNETNINRQIIALHSTVGRKKVEVMAARIADINPQAKTEIFDIRYDAETLERIDLSRYDYVIDAIDTVTSKLLLIEQAKKNSIKIISCMGTGNKLEPSLFQVDDIKKTSVCPLAKVMRRELKARGIVSLKVLYSTEEPVKTGMRTPASISFCPSVAGLLIAGEVVRELTERGE